MRFFLTQNPIPASPPGTTFGRKMGVTHLEPVTMTVTPLPELAPEITSCVLLADAHVIVLALNSKCRAVLLAHTKGLISNVGESSNCC